MDQRNEWNMTLLDIAADLDHENMVKILITAGSKLGYPKSLVNEFLPPNRHINTIHMLKDLFFTPRSLQQDCRLMIRKSLGFNIQSKIDSLPLPQRIKEFLMLDELCL